MSLPNTEDEYKDELFSLGYTMIEYDWLIMDNITFTTEVCLDHVRSLDFPPSDIQITLGLTEFVIRHSSLLRELCLNSIFRMSKLP